MDLLYFGVISGGVEIRCFEFEPGEYRFDILYRRGSVPEQLRFAICDGSVRATSTVGARSVCGSDAFMQLDALFPHLDDVLWLLSMKGDVAPLSSIAPQVIPVLEQYLLPC